MDIEDLDKKYNAIIERQPYSLPTQEDMDVYRPLILELYNCDNTRDMYKLFRKHNFGKKRSFLYKVYKCLFAEDNVHIRNLLAIKRTKSQSGVLVITVFTSAYPQFVNDKGEIEEQSFSCEWNCAYCMSEPGQPRSYLKGEPGVLRANKNKFDCLEQMHDRMNTLYNIGHDVDKLEVIVLGGTWTSYPLPYREQFIRDIYYAANSYFDKDHTDRLSLNDEKKINQTAKVKVIGLTLETRPDTINPETIKHFRYYGCTRVQLGIQHLDDGILTAINRRCTTRDAIDAIRLLKETGFKVDAHFMPNLPGATPTLDRGMFDMLLGTTFPVPVRTIKGSVKFEDWSLKHPEFQVDQWKIYPCAITPWTDIKKWYEEGSYVPYAESELLDILLNVKTIVFPWIRLNRIVRDIPTDYIIASSDTPNMRQDLQKILQQEGKMCRCIRCREVKDNTWQGEYHVVVRKYGGSGGDEHFISAEFDKDVLLGFVRLRISNTNVFPELVGCALIRELHVYGKLQCVGKTSGHVQHMGIGTRLLEVAEGIARRAGNFKVAVISGEGSKMYYQKRGYFEDVGEGSYMIKTLL